MKILFVVQQFRQGWGGGPESVRLMANLLASRGIESDVFDLGRLRRNVERLELLPVGDAGAEPFPYESLGHYHAVLIVGPWQSPMLLRKVLKGRAKDKPLLYLPRGGLGRIEFSRPRDIKKFPYFALVERRLLDASDGVVFSSHAEQDKTIGPARRRAAEHIIPDFFDSPDLATSSVDGIDRRSAGADAPLTCSFLAEISPRKGLLPLVEGFAAWARRHQPGRKVRLVVGGQVRPGSERYRDKALAAAAAHPDLAIEFIGPVPHNERARFYAETDLMVVSSHFESYGLTVLEAMSAGCAVLAAPAIGALEYLPEHRRLFVAEEASPAAFAAGLARAIPRIGDDGPDARAGTRRVAADAIAAINARALDSWMELLA